MLNLSKEDVLLFLFMKECKEINVFERFHRIQRIVCATSIFFMNYNKNAESREVWI